VIRQLRRASAARLADEDSPLRSAGWRTNTMCLMLHSGTIFRPVSSMPWERSARACGGVRSLSCAALPGIGVVGALDDQVSVKMLKCGSSGLRHR
jgi:hypothetical protein